jgi:hypothetical protein
MINGGVSCVDWHNLNPLSYALGVKMPLTNDFSILLSKILSILPPYMASVINILIASHGTFSESKFLLLPATFYTHCSNTSATHFKSE